MIFRHVILVWWVCILPLFILGQSFSPGSTYYDSTGYVKYQAGNIPIIISAPHGGILEPASIPDLSCNGTPSGLIDAYTKQIAEGVYDQFFIRTGCYPHVIFNLVHKKKFEANRDIGDAACGHPIVESAWFGYHRFIDSAKAQVVADYGRGLFLDLHAHAHPIQRIELGYLLSKSELQSSDSLINTNLYIEESSIRGLSGTNVQGLSHADLIRGPQSFGTLMENKGLPAVPSTLDPYPQTGQAYFRGGYNTQRHSSRDNNGAIDGIQIEFNQTIRFDSTQRKNLIDSLTTSIIEYIDLHYNDQFIGNYCNLVLGIPTSEIEQYDFRVYPNPAHEYFYFDSNVKQFDLAIYNQLGQKILSTNTTRKETDIRTLPPGIYVIQIRERGEHIGNIQLIKN